MVVLKKSGKNLKVPAILLLVALISFDGYSQKIATLEVDLSTATQGMSVNAQVNLDEITFIADSALTLASVEGSKRISIPFQVSHGKQRKDQKPTKVHVAAHRRLRRSLPAAPGNRHECANLSNS